MNYNPFYNCFFPADHNITNNDDVHAYQVFEFRPHVMSPKCWCKPTLVTQDVEGRVFQHNSPDHENQNLH